MLKTTYGEIKEKITRELALDPEKNRLSPALLITFLQFIPDSNDQIEIIGIHHVDDINFYTVFYQLSEGVMKLDKSASEKEITQKIKEALPTILNDDKCWNGALYSD